MTWAIWWPVGLAGVLLAADLFVMRMQAAERRAIVAARDGLAVTIATDERRQRERLAEILGAIAQLEAARGEVDAARAAMDEAEARYRAGLAEAGRGQDGNVVQLRVVQPEPLNSGG